MFDLEAAVCVGNVGVCMSACVCTLHKCWCLAAHTPVGIFVLWYMPYDESSLSGGQACAQCSKLLSESLAPAVKVLTRGWTFA